MRFRKDPGRPGPARALAECSGGRSAVRPWGTPHAGVRDVPAEASVAPAVRQRQPRRRPATPPPPPHAQAPRHGRSQAAATGLQDPVRRAAARQGAGGPAGSRRPPPDPGRRRRPPGPRSVHRHHCRVASHGDGPGSHSHSTPAAVVRHPERREAPPLAPEPVARTGGDRRNGCGRNAAARSVEDLQRERPHLKAIFLQDGLDAGGALHELRCLNGAPASASRPDIRASVTGCRETVTRRKRIAGRHRGPDDSTHRVEGKRKGLIYLTENFPRCPARVPVGIHFPSVRFQFFQAAMP